MNPDIDLSPDSPPSASAAPAPAAPTWEQQTLRELLVETLKEQRARRRWNIFFRLVTLVYVTVFLVWLLDLGNFGGVDAGEAHTAVIDIEGEIGFDAQTTAEATVESLQAAFRDSGARGVILRINSPGGSPVQAGLIYDEVRRLRAEHKDKPVYAVIEELGASAAYYVAAAADRVYVNRASLVGSIGVLIDSFGFTGAMDKLGIERRLLAAGANKGMLDPFSPMSPAQRTHAQAMLDNIHQQFITAVREGRGERLQETPEIFSGLVWTGEQGVKLGLVDELGSVESVARDVIKAETLVDYTQRRSLLDRAARQLGARFGAAFRSALTQPALR